MIYLISHRSTSNITLQTIIWFLSFSLKTHNFLQIDAESGSLWTLLCNKKIQHMLLSPCSSTFMSSNNLDYLMLQYGNNQIIMNISCMYRTCALTSDTTPVCYKHRICKQNRISKFSRLTIRACWSSWCWVQCSTSHLFQDDIFCSSVIVLSILKGADSIKHIWKFYTCLAKTPVW